jgi:hypothetical protein
MEEKTPVQKTSSQESSQPSKTIEDKNLIESILYLKQNHPLPESHSKIKFETVKEAEDDKKEEVVLLIKETLNATKQTITELQKAGYNLHLETIKLIGIPLKIKVWLSNSKKKELENIFKTFEEVNSIIIPMKKENEAKIAEKERQEKLIDQQEKEEAQKKIAPTPQTPTQTKTPNTQPTTNKPNSPEKSPTPLPTTHHLASSSKEQISKPTTEPNKPQSNKSSH